MNLTKCVLGISDGSGNPETRVLGFGSVVEKWVLGKFEQGFSSYFAKYLHIWWFLKVVRAEGIVKLWKIIKICQKFGKKVKEPWFNLP